MFSLPLSQTGKMIDKHSQVLPAVCCAVFHCQSHLYSYYVD